MMKLKQLIETSGVVMHYDLAQTPFGPVLLASTAQGLCYMVFVEEEGAEALQLLEAQFPGAQFLPKTDNFQQQALAYFRGKGAGPSNLVLHIQGSAFQFEVWEKLLKTPFGSTTTYGEIARIIGLPGASRAVGSAVGSNPVACLIPCHRVIRGDGSLGGYRWGMARKSAILAWESVEAECLIPTPY